MKRSKRVKKIWKKYVAGVSLKRFAFHVMYEGLKDLLHITEAEINEVREWAFAKGVKP